MSDPPPSPVQDQDTSLDEIDALEGKEKFRALRKRLSSSSTMYSPIAASPDSSSSAPPPRDEVGTAKKLTHATKNRPRRKVRLPSRERRSVSVESVEPPLQSPLNDVEYVPAPPLSPPPGAEPAFPEVLATPPPPSLTTEIGGGGSGSPTTAKTTRSSPLSRRDQGGPSTSTPSIRNSPVATTTTTTATTATAYQAGDTSIDPVVIGPFKNRPRKTKESRSSKPNRISTPSTDLPQTSPPKPASNTAEVVVAAESSPSLVRSSHNSGIPQKSPPVISRRDKAASRLSSNAKKDKENPNMKASSFISTTSGDASPNLPIRKESSDDDDEFPSVPPPPVPDLPPPDIMEFHSGELKDNMPSPKIPEKLSSHSAEQHSSVEAYQQKELWKQKTVDLEGAMNSPLPLFIQSKDTENKTRVRDSFKNSSESLSSLPDFPPPTVPATPPPMIPGEEGNDDIVLLMELQPTKESPQMKYKHVTSSPLLSSSRPRPVPTAETLPAPALPESLPPTPPKSLPPTPPESLPPTLPVSTLPPESLPPTHPDSLPESLSPTLPHSFPPTHPEHAPLTLPGSLPQSLPATVPETTPPEPPVSPLPTLSGSTSNEQQSPPFYTPKPISTSTPTPDISARTPSAKSSPETTPPSNQRSRNPTPPQYKVSPRISKPEGSTNQSASSNDLKSNSFGVKLRMKEQLQPNWHRQSLPVTMDTNHGGGMVKVISHGSPPASPDLKFTRVAKMTWKSPKKLADDLCASASTGDMLDGYRATTGLVTASLQSIRSNDSSSFERRMLSHKNRFSTTSPLMAAASSTATPISNVTTASRTPSEATSLGEAPTRNRILTTSEDEVSSNENLLHHKKVSGRLRRGQLDVVRRETTRAQDSPVGSFVLDSNLLDYADPEKWGLDEVCQWLDLVGLGSFKQAFKARNVNGYMLLHMDVRLFAELGIDSHEIREIFLAKIYELSNPCSSGERMEDDFLLTVDTYNSDDWQKLKAAINVLKNPVLDDSVLLEPSAIGQYLHTNYIRSQSSPSIDNMTDEELQMLHGGSLSPTAIDYKAPEAFDEGQGRYGSNGHTRRASEGLLSAYRVRVSDSSEGYNGSPYTTNVEGEENMVNNWVAGLPEYGRRSRSHTEPLVPLARLSTATKSESIESFDNCKVKTLPNYLSPVPAQQEGGVDAQGKGTSVPQLRVAAAETRLSPPRYSSPSKRSSVQSTSPPSSGLDFRPNSIPSPTSPVNSRSKLVKVYMSKVQKGCLYKSFVADQSTTVEDVLIRALKKVNLTNQDPHNYCIVETETPNGGSRSLEPSESIMELVSKHTQLKNHRFELRQKRRPTAEREPVKMERNGERLSGALDGQSQSIIAHMHALEDKNKGLRKQLDTMQLQVMNHKEIKEKLSTLQESYLSLDEKYQEEHVNNKKAIQQLQDRLDKVSLARRRTEEQLLLTGSSSGERDTKGLLDDIQAKYSDEVSNLKSENRVKEKTLLDMRAKRIALEEEVGSLKDKVKYLDKDIKLLNERNKQIHSLERDMAIKEDMIHRLLAEKEQAQMVVNQTTTLQKSLQAIESNSKQQQELSNRTMRELKEHLDRVMQENTQKEQLLLALKKERDRLSRENQTKDALNTSLEADMESYKSLMNASSLSESSRILTLQRSISVHEVAKASLKAEFDRQNLELVAAEEELSKLRKSLAQKDEQLSLLTSIDDSTKNSQRSSLYSSLAQQPPHFLIAAQIFHPEGESKDSEGVGITCTVTTFPGEVRGCVINHMEEHMESTGLLTGDRILEINDLDVTSMSPREVNDLLQRHYQDTGGLKVVIVRLMNSEQMKEDSSAGVIERYKKLNSSLSVRLDSQNAEVDHWRQECNRLKSEILKYSTAQKDKDMEIKYLKCSVQDSKQQLESAEKSAKQLKEVMTEIEGEQGHQQYLGMMEEGLKKKEKEVKRMKAAEKARIAELKKLKKEKEKAVKTVRQYAVNMEDLKDILPRHRVHLDNLANSTRAEMMSTVHVLEEDLSHHKVYLDQLLSVVIDQNPELLSKIEDAQKISRDKLEDDSWC